MSERSEYSLLGQKTTMTLLLPPKQGCSVLTVPGLVWSGLLGTFFKVRPFFFRFFLAMTEIIFPSIEGENEKSNTRSHTHTQGSLRTPESAAPNHRIIKFGGTLLAKAHRLTCVCVCACV